MSRFQYSAGSRSLAVGALDGRYEPFPQLGAPRTRPAAGNSPTMAHRRCPSRQQRTRLDRLTPTQREALLLDVFDGLPAHEAARSMQITVEQFETELAAARRRMTGS